MRNTSAPFHGPVVGTLPRTPLAIPWPRKGGKGGILTNIRNFDIVLLPGYGKGGLMSYLLDVSFPDAY